MRIAVVNSLRVTGGGEKWAVRLAPCWQERGHQVRILCQPGSGLEKRAGGAHLGTAPTVMRHDRWLPGVLHRLEHGPLALNCSAEHASRPSSAYA